MHTVNEKYKYIAYLHNKNREAVDLEFFNNEMKAFKWAITHSKNYPNSMVIVFDRDPRKKIFEYYG